MTVVVLGGTGTTGRRVTAQLRRLGHDPRPASRHTPTPFDWQDESTWRPVLRGATGLYLMAPHELPVDPALLAVAVAAGIRHLALLSSRSIEEMGDRRLLAAERDVAASGAAYTVLRADWFDQNFDEGFFRDAVLAGQLAVPVGGTRFAFVDADDIAAVAARVLAEPAAHAGRTYEVTGPASLSFAEAAEVIGAAAGRPVRFDGGAEAYRAGMRALGSPPEQTEAEIRAFAALESAGHSAPTTVVADLTGRPARSLAEYAARAAAGGAWPSPGPS
ncbi:NmrA family transcriptional regulator [Catellatospora sp. NPDC049609]|uniref:NmrA family transcriptional regulator n=1 Tax=Catellatospora sp. NPDC049609 TaxID=3155505 RepID=UPI0034449070